eukprot:Pgem_evm1s19846
MICFTKSVLTFCTLSLLNFSPYAVGKSVNVNQQTIIIQEAHPEQAGNLLGVLHSTTNTKAISNKLRRDSGNTNSYMNISGSGLGSISGAGFTVPGRSTANIDITLNFPVLSSQNVKDIQSLVEASIAASKQSEYYKEVQKQASVSGSVSFFDCLFGGLKASASASEVTQNMEKYGISESNQVTIINAIAEMMTKTSTMQYRVEIDNSDSEWSRSGNFYAYTISGTISTVNGQTQYRVLSDTSNYGSTPSDSAPATGDIIPL